MLGVLLCEICRGQMPPHVTTCKYPQFYAELRPVGDAERSVPVSHASLGSILSQPVLRPTFLLKTTNQPNPLLEHLLACRWACSLFLSLSGKPWFGFCSRSNPSPSIVGERKSHCHGLKGQCAQASPHHLSQMEQPRKADIIAFSLQVTTLSSIQGNPPKVREEHSRGSDSARPCGGQNDLKCRRDGAPGPWQADPAWSWPFRGPAGAGEPALGTRWLSLCRSPLGDWIFSCHICEKTRPSWPSFWGSQTWVFLWPDNYLLSAFWVSWAKPGQDGRTEALVQVPCSWNEPSKVKLLSASFIITPHFFCSVLTVNLLIMVSITFSLTVVTPADPLTTSPGKGSHDSRFHSTAQKARISVSSPRPQASCQNHISRGQRWVLCIYLIKLPVVLNLFSQRRTSSRTQAGTQRIKSYIYISGCLCSCSAGTCAGTC